MDAKTADSPPLLLLTPEQAADALRLGRSRIDELMRDRPIRSVKIGRSRRIPCSSLLDFVASLEQRRHRTRLTSQEQQLTITRGADLPALTAPRGYDRMSRWAAVTS